MKKLKGQKLRQPIQLLKRAIKQHPVYLTFEDNMETEEGIIRTARLVLDRIYDDYKDPFTFGVPPLKRRRH